jgi:mannan endo-1,4-beta-mannosidase
MAYASAEPGIIMKLRFWLFLLAILSGAAASASAASPALRNFITVKGDQLMEGNRPFRFVSFNIPNLHLVEDNMVFGDNNAWRWPDRFEITDALQSIQQQGGGVVRTYVLSVVRTNDGPNVPRHVLGPGKFNEEGFRALDLVLKISGETGVRVIIPFVDNWSWWGGIAEYAGFRGKPQAAFWTDPQVMADFKETIRYLVNRTNTYTGVPYRQDKAILCWETGNELQSPAAWTRQIAAFIKSLDPNHPVMDGYHTTELREESLAMPEVDIVTTHHYPGGKKSFAQLIRENGAKAKGRKPYVVGEFGFVDTADITASIDAIIESGAAGGLLWSLRYRDRDGGFYWHYEPAGGNKYKAYHWPGFPSGASYDEANLMRLMQQKAFQIRGAAIPRLRSPAAPHLLPTTTVALSWQGSVGASSYAIERSAAAHGPWSQIAAGVDETAVQYHPLFVDMTAPNGAWYYRVRARNAAGDSRPSNVVGPIIVSQGTFVDELADLTRIHHYQGTAAIKTRDCRQAKEDAHRLAGEPGTTLVYQVNGPIQSAKVYTFFPGEIAALKFAVSADNRSYTAVSNEAVASPVDAGDYGYWKAVLFRCQPLSRDARYLRIEFGAPTQLGRIEIDYGR